MPHAPLCRCCKRNAVFVFQREREGAHTLVKGEDIDHPRRPTHATSSGTHARLVVRGAFVASAALVLRVWLKQL